MGARKYLRLGVLCSATLVLGCVADAATEEDLAADEADLEQQVRLAQQSSVRPIVVVAGMMEDQKTVAPLADFLRGRGFDVTVWVPANLGLEDINGYAKKLGKVVDAVQRRTGATKVDLVGHSQGGVTGRRFAQLAGDDLPVHTLVSLGAPQQGTEIDALSKLLVAAGVFDWAQGAKQLTAGSKFLTEMNTKRDPTPGDARYVAIGTRLDQVTKPVSQSAIPGGENIVMQEACPEREVGHLGLLEDAWVQQVILSVLAGGPAEGACDALPLGGPN